MKLTIALTLLCLPALSGADWKPAENDGRILVPFPVESALSGVKQRLTPEQRLEASPVEFVLFRAVCRYATSL
jgi:hypothetical protein